MRESNVRDIGPRCYGCGKPFPNLTCDRCDRCNALLDARPGLAKARYRKPYSVDRHSKVGA